MAGLCPLDFSSVGILSRRDFDRGIMSVNQTESRLFISIKFQEESIGYGAIFFLFSCFFLNFHPDRGDLERSKLAPETTEFLLSRHYNIIISCNCLWKLFFTQILVKWLMHYLCHVPAWLGGSWKFLRANTNDTMMLPFKRRFRQFNKKKNVFKQSK